MQTTTACIAGEEIYRQWQAGHISGRRVGSRATPFGPSGELFLVDGDGPAFYLMPRYGPAMRKSSPYRVNYRANLYALKDVGVQHILAWGPGGAITHNIAVGDLVIPDDLVDLTHLRAKTFFDDSPLGFLRQFPVFCPTLRRLASEALGQMKLVYHGEGTAAVSEGPRLETPAEVRMLATFGAHFVTHTFVPEMFLARELGLCYAAICYVVNYAETGSKHRPFAVGDLFGGLTRESDDQRLAGAVRAMNLVTQAVAAALAAGEKSCECDKAMAANVRKYGLPQDWRKWFE